MCSMAGDCCRPRPRLIRPSSSVRETFSFRHVSCVDSPLSVGSCHAPTSSIEPAVFNIKHNHVFRRNVHREERPSMEFIADLIRPDNRYCREIASLPHRVVCCRSRSSPSTSIFRDCSRGFSCRGKSTRCSFPIASQPLAIQILRARFFHARFCGRQNHRA